VLLLSPPLWFRDFLRLCYGADSENFLNQLEAIGKMSEDELSRKKNIVGEFNLGSHHVSVHLAGFKSEFSLSIWLDETKNNDVFKRIQQLK
jgi:hypothetical protein